MLISDPEQLRAVPHPVPQGRTDAVFVPDGEEMSLREIFGRARQNEPGPQAYVVDCPPQMRAAAHFHPVDQFQLFYAEGGGWYQRTPIDGLTVHYADAYTTYGPFGTNGPEKLEFFTLRATSTVETMFMPGSRDRLVPSDRRRSIHVDIQPGSSPAETGAPSMSHAIELADDGLAVYVVSVGADDSFAIAPITDGSPGAYAVVVAGSVVVDRVAFGERSIVWFEPTEASRPLHSGPGGAEVMVMQLPRPRGGRE